ncbi:MAG TPA: M48 family metallopeptidase [Candidatus Binatia bacterium]
MKLTFPIAKWFFLSIMLASCAVSGGTEPNRSGSAEVPDVRQVDPRQAQRLYNIMTPLLRAMDHPKGARDVRIGIIDSQEINAANAGGGQFYVTRGLLDKANDNQLQGILAHEIAHDDLGHVARLQILGAGLNVGVVLLEELLPGSGAVTPIVGELIARGYSRSEEYAADRHGVEILRRAGYSKQIMVDALAWVNRTSGGGGGGFLSTHPATEDRIAELRRIL